MTPPSNPIRNSSSNGLSRKVSSKTSLVLLYLASAVCLWLYFRSLDQWTYHEGFLDIPTLGLLVVYTSLIPAYGYFYRKRQVSSSDVIPFIPMMGVIYGLYYGFPVLLGELKPLMKIAIYDDALHRSLWLALDGWCCFMIGYYWIGKRIRAGGPLKLHFDYKKAKLLGTVLILGGFSVSILKKLIVIPIEFQRTVNFIGDLSDVGLGIFIILSLRGALKRQTRFLLWFIAIPYYLYLQLATGLFATLLTAAIFILMLIFACGKKIPWGPIILLVVSIIMLRSVLGDFRKDVWHGGAGKKMSAVEKANYFVSLVNEKRERQSWSDTFQEGLENIQVRISMIGIFAHVVHLTPDQIPYWNGATYHTLWTTWIPRFLWHNKPRKTIGQDFGHRYYILDENDTKTSANLPILIEFYANYGVGGVLCGMLLLGILYRFINNKINSIHSGEMTILAAAIIFKKLLIIETDFGQLHGDMLQQIIVLYFIFRFAKQSKTKRIVSGH